MNIINLIKSAGYLYNEVTDDVFDITVLRKDGSNKMADYTNKVCETIGCAAGHLTSIIPDDQIIFDHHNEIDFIETISKFLEIDVMQWNYLFSSRWDSLDHTRKGVIQRIFYLLEGNTIYEIGYPRHSIIDIEFSIKKYKLLYNI